ncbi:glycosyl hydrolase-related protein [Spiroplasma turonicum]|uniref:Glycosyl hydrolase, family 38 n=1 Tax=Spiroplasma turonicum TaxID=216946 RepID=A0A0K1P6U1_9MOLU|nr:glycosyl hydrolase-related protein [Spiroplasma turonicum]AKU79939.1 glycosyl hydrolase, family 38 [Spiroplasma turonicum]ALX70952.1 alpha-mannosidase [Spiroplasma turonicum]
MNEKNNKWIIHLVAHTHWDKEWYFTKQDSDILLNDNVNNLLNMLDNNEISNFTFDGQYSIIEDYIKYNPDNKTKIEKYVKDKKIIIGPWYTQPDFFNSGSESIIRNLLYGIKGCQSINSDYLKVAYVPDSFGHNNQMPQIYNSFGLNRFLYWRGISKKIIDNNGIINDWVGIDGSKILSYNLLFGYWPFGSYYPYLELNKSNINLKAKEFYENTKLMIDEIKNKSLGITNSILIPIGGDQAPILNYFNEFVNEINNLSNDQWIVSDYDTFFDNINISTNNLPMINEELRFPYLSRVHRTIGSQRQDIKYILKKLETELYLNLEPLMSYYFLIAKKYDKSFIDEIIKNILLSQAHDSLGGCNSDRTNSDIKNRIERSYDLVQSIETKILKIISKNVNLENESLLIFNTELFDTCHDYFVKIFTKHKYFNLEEKNGEIVNYSVIKSSYCESGMSVKPSINGEKVESLDGFYEHDILINDLKIDSLFFSVLNIVKKNEIYIDKYISNFKITLDKNMIVIKNNYNDDCYKIIFECTYDFGDSYDYSPKSFKTEEINTFLNSSIEHIIHNRLNISQITIDYLVPESEKKSKKILQKFFITIYEYENNKLTFNINTTNNSSELRWRFIILSPKELKSTFNDQCYSIIDRNHNEYLKTWEIDKWKEAPINIEPFEYICGVRNVFCIYSKFLNEYEMFDNNKFAITLYRSVSFLGKNDLLFRPGRSSGTSEYNLKTFDSRLINYNFDVSLTIDFNNNVNNLLESRHNIKNTLYYQNQNYNTLHKKFDRFLLKIPSIEIKSLGISLSNTDFIVKTFKKAEKTNDLIIRGFNPLDKDINLSLKNNNTNNNILFNVLDLNEDIKHINKNEILIKKNEIITISIKGDILDD